LHSSSINALYELSEAEQEIEKAIGAIRMCALPFDDFLRSFCLEDEIGWMLAGLDSTPLTADRWSSAKWSTKRDSRSVISEGRWECMAVAATGASEQTSRDAPKSRSINVIIEVIIESGTVYVEPEILSIKGNIRFAKDVGARSAQTFAVPRCFLGCDAAERKVMAPSRSHCKY
jgi:hypothetical protein